MGEYWEATVAALQSPSNPIVDKPKLTDKYLTKPPFRYLHDIVSAVQAKTGFAPGLYAGQELDGKAIQDKDSKVSYLAKIIDVIGIVLGEHVPAKPVKIVAGLEPENTNVFLQMLGRACQLSDGADAVQRVLAGEHQPAPGAAPAAPPPPMPAPAQRPSSRPSSQQRTRDVDASPPPVRADDPPPSKPEKDKKKSDSGHGGDKVRRSQAGEREVEKRSATKAKAPPPPAPSDEPPAPEPAAPPMRSSSPSEDPMRASTQNRFNRPQSARKAPPKLPVAPGPVVPTPTARPGTASRRPGSGQSDRPGSGSQAPAVQVFGEGQAGNDDDDDVEVVHEAAPIALGPGANMGGEKGVLVKDILEAQKNLQKAGDEAAAEQEPQSTGIILKRIGSVGRSATNQIRPGDPSTVRELVQKMCQASHPLAKTMDYLQEDVENMSKEYRFWVTERRVYQDKLSEEMRLMGETAGVEAQLADLDGQIRQVRDRITGLKAGILRNDDKISKLLSMATSGGK